MMLWSKLKQRVDAEGLSSKKLVKALKKVAPFVPHEIGDQVWIFTPGKRTLGAVFSYSGLIMYLKRPTRSYSQNEVNFTVAHEFAHLILHHPQNNVPSGRLAEKEANTLAQKWGFSSVLVK